MNPETVSVRIVPLSDLVLQYDIEDQLLMDLPYAEIDFAAVYIDLVDFIDCLVGCGIDDIVAQIEDSFIHVNERVMIDIQA